MNSHLNPRQQKNLDTWLQQLNENLLQECIHEGKFTYWKTLERSKANHRESQYKANTTIYNGNAGIILYLLSVYCYNKEEAYLNLAKTSTAWLMRQVSQDKNTHTALYTGRSGLLYILCCMYELTKETNYRNQAVSFLDQNRKYFKNHYSDDLLSGNAGNLLVLYKAYEISGEPWVRDLLLECIGDLIDNTFLSTKGVKWRYRPNFIDSLCGFSHGAAGIGFVLLELANVYQSPGLLWLGKQAYEYESQHYSEDFKSWPDLRIHPKKLEQEGLVENVDKLMKGENVNGWAHGGVGIAMTRLRGYVLTRKLQYKREALKVLKHAIYKNTDKRITNFTVTNGYASLCYLLAYGGSVLDNKALTQQAFDIIQDAVSLKANLGYMPSGWDASKPDQSIFMGQLGIGFCLLYLLKPACPYDPIVPSIRQHPKYPVEHTPSISDVKQKIIQRYFPKTLAYFSGFSLFDDMDESLHSAIQKVGGSFDELTEKTRDEAKKQFFLENEKLNLELKKPSFEFLYRNYQRITGIHKSIKYDQSLFSLSDYMKIIDTESNSPRLIIKRRYGVEEYVLEPFGYKLLTTLGQIEKKTFSELLDHFYKSLSGQFSYDQCEEFLTRQIKEYMKAGIIKQTEINPSANFFI